MEIGWYLRFAKSDTVAMKADATARAQIEYALTIHSDWRVDIREEADHIVAVYTRKEPVWSKRKATGSQGTEQS